MQFLYNSSIVLVVVILRIIALFNPKIKLFVKGREQVFSKLEREISKTDKVVWVHCASLGEFEQGRPVIEKLKSDFKKHKVVLTFFSPSGYEVQKNYDLADVVVYLPLDTKRNAKKFLKVVHPSVAVFVKYEFWPNLLTQLSVHNIPTLLVSGIFRKEQVFFKNYGGWMRSKLKAFSFFFLQDRSSSDLLTSIGFENNLVCGDTRFDRVYDIISRDNKLDYIDEFVNSSPVLVAGSTWQEDEDLLVDYILNHSKETEKFIIAPHNIKEEGILRLKKSLKGKAVLFSEKEGQSLQDFKVFIIDTVGILTKIYAVADVAYVGGGYTKSGIHNVLEPATFGVPVVIGPNFKKFREAKDLVNLGGVVSTSDHESVNAILKKFSEEDVFRKERGEIALNYIKQSLGASDKIMNYLKTLL